VLLLVVVERDGDPERPLEIAADHVAKVDVDRVVDLQSVLLGIVADEGFRREGERDDRLLAVLQRFQRGVSCRVRLDGEQHLVDDVVHDRGELGRVGCDVAQPAVHRHAGRILLQPLIDPLLAELAQFAVEGEERADRLGEVGVVVLVDRRDLEPVLDAVEGPLAARILAGIAASRRRSAGAARRPSRSAPRSFGLLTAFAMSERCWIHHIGFLA